MGQFLLYLTDKKHLRYVHPSHFPIFILLISSCSGVRTSDASESSALSVVDAPAKKSTSRAKKGGKKGKQDDDAEDPSADGEAAAVALETSHDRMCIQLCHEVLSEPSGLFPKCVCLNDCLLTDSVPT